MAIGIIQAICGGCSCDEQQAQEYLDDELRYLRELREVNDMQHSDIEVNDMQHSDIELACTNLGIEADYEEYFIQALAV